MSWSTRITSAPNRSRDPAGSRRPRWHGLLVGQPGSRARRARRPAACRRRRGRPRRGAAHARRARPTFEPWDGAVQADEVDGGAARRRVRVARPAPECSWIIATLSKIDSCSTAISRLERRAQPPARPPVVGHLQEVLAEAPVTAPAAGRTNPLSTLKNVVLPAPFGPIRPGRRRRAEDVVDGRSLPRTDGSAP